MIATEGSLYYRVSNLSSADVAVVGNTPVTLTLNYHNFLNNDRFETGVERIEREDTELSIGAKRSF